MEQIQVHNAEALGHLVNRMGFLPFYYNDITGFSAADYTPSQYWFPEEGDGIWEWKGPAIIEGSLAYGKFFNDKAGFISLDWFSRFLNYRRSKYALSHQEVDILQAVKEHHSLLSKDIKRLCGYIRQPAQRATNPLEKVAEKQLKIKPKATKAGRESFETAITRLQMGAQIITADFEYQYDKQGKRYGWGVSRYCTPEDFFGKEHFEAIEESPEESYNAMYEHLQKLLPQATDAQIIKLIG